LFAYTRAREMTAVRRLGLAALTPLLPALLLVRHARLQFGKSVSLRRFLIVSPLVFLFLVVWSLGEAIGYTTVRP
jgi:hypothetical protein